MKNPTEPKRHTGSFEKESVLRYKFIPKFQIDGNGINKTFICDSGYALNVGILNQVTNGLGYNGIRQSRKTNITTEELYSHLEEMDKRVRGADKSRYWAAIEGLINGVEQYRNFSHELVGKFEKLYKTGKEYLPLKNELLSLDETLIQIQKNKLEEKNAEIKRLRTKLNQKSLWARVFG